MAFKFKVAYTKDDEKIQPAIDAGTLDAGDLIIKDNDDGSFVMRFLDQDTKILKETCITDEDVESKIVPITDELYVKKGQDALEDGTILNGGSKLDIEEVISEVASATDLAAAINDTSVTKVTLTADITNLQQALTVTERSLTLDLAGHKITNDVDLWVDGENWSLFNVTNGTLVINGNEGSIQAKENDGFVITCFDGGTIEINGGTYVGNITAVYLYGENSACYITDGNFSVQQKASGNKDPNQETINTYDKVRSSAYVEITGGTFPYDYTSPPENGEMQYIPDGYVSTLDSTTGLYTVTKEG